MLQFFVVGVLWRSIVIVKMQCMGSIAVRISLRRTDLA